MFIVVKMASHIYPVKLEVIPPKGALAAYTEPTCEELVERLRKVTMAATARGGKGSAATLMTWHHWLGHPSFKTVMELAKSGVSRMVITDVPAMIPGLDACVACVAGKSVHLPHKEGCEQTEEYLGWVHVDIAGPMLVQSAGGKLYEYVAVDNYSRTVYTRPLGAKLEAPEAFKIFKAATENESQKKVQEVMTDNARELCMGEMKEICKTDRIKLRTSVRYSPESNRVTERTIGVLTNSVHAMLRDSGLPKSLWAEAFSAATYVHNRTPTKALGGRTPYKVLYGNKPDVSHLRAFGAPCAVIEPKEKLKKLND